MSSPPPNTPYKSRFLNTINRTFLKWNNNSKININKLKIAAKWGVQILIYPIYIGIQTARVAVGQLLSPSKNKTSSDNHSLPSNIDNEIEQPIDKILKVVNPQLPISIKGIASELANQKIVLINQENKLVHLENNIQEKQLKNWIKWELANYYRNQKLLKLNQKNPHYLSPIKVNNSHVIFPLNIFWLTMAWIEKSPIAITLNLFGELYVIQKQQKLDHNSQLNVINDHDDYSHIHNYIEKNNYLQSSTVITQIDQKISSLETNENIINLSKYIQNISQKFHHLTSEKTQLNFNHNSDNPFTIKAIIIAAIDYFFGESNKDKNITTSNNFNLSLSTSSELSDNNLLDYAESFIINNTNISQTLDNKDNSRQKQLNTATIEKTIADPWLASDDVFELTTNSRNYSADNNGNNSDQINVSEINNFHLLSENPKPSRLTRIKEVLSNLKSQNLSSQSISWREIPTQATDNLFQNVPEENLTKISSEAPIKVKEILTYSEVKLNSYNSGNQGIDNDDSYVETPATHIGYEKHFLEYILEWLDNIIVTIEESIINIFKWFKNKI